MPKGERFVSSATICFPSLGAVGWRHRSVSIGPGRPLVKCLLSIDEVLPVFRWNCMNPPKPPFDLWFYHVVSHIFFEFFWLHVRGWWSDCLFKWFIRFHPIYDDPFNKHMFQGSSAAYIGDQLPRCDAHRSPLRGWAGDDPVGGDLNPHNWRKTRID